MPTAKTNAPNKRNGRRSALDGPKVISRTASQSPTSHQASRSRRDKEKRAVVELSQLLPLSAPIRDQLDKSGVVRIAIAHIQLRRLLLAPSIQLSASSAFHPVRPLISSNPDPNPTTELLHLFAFNVFQTLSGFLIILDHSARLVYVSETAAVHLGLSQVDMVGGSLEAVVHPEDMQMAGLLLAIGIPSEQMAVLDPEIRFTLRFKCALGRRNAGVVVAGGYKPIHFNGRIVAQDNCRFIGYGQPLVAHGLNELRLSPSMWMFRADMALRMVFVDSRVAYLTGYGAGSLLDLSLYALVHAEDVGVLRDAHVGVLRQSQAISGYYRLLAQGGGWLWVRSKFSLVITARNPHLTLLLGITSVLGGVDESGGVCDIIQQLPPANKDSHHGQMLGEYSEQFYTTARLH